MGTAVAFRRSITSCRANQRTETQRRACAPSTSCRASLSCSPRRRRYICCSATADTEQQNKENVPSHTALTAAYPVGTVNETARTKRIGICQISEVDAEGSLKLLEDHGGNRAHAADR